MFTGIIKGLGSVVELTDVGGDRRLQIDVSEVDLGAIAPGDSIAVNGVCLTATQCANGRFAADVSVETLERTTLGGLEVGAAVNLEPALRVGESLGGHFVSGHVDGVGRIRQIEPVGRSQRIRIELDAALTPYVASKGSIAVDGVSLTVNAVTASGFDVNIVPHTRQMTVISAYRVGTAVNIEVDVIARYLERLALSGGRIDLEFLKAHGYAIDRQ